MPEVEFPDTKLMQAAQELLEDRYAEVVKHFKDNTVLDTKKCKITIEVEVSTNRQRSAFTCFISAKTSLASREGAYATLFSSVDPKSGHVINVEYEPQVELPLGNSKD